MKRTVLYLCAVLTMLLVIPAASQAATAQITGASFSGAEQMTLTGANLDSTISVYVSTSAGTIRYYRPDSNRNSDNPAISLTWTDSSVVISGDSRLIGVLVTSGGAGTLADNFPDFWISPQLSAPTSTVSGAVDQTGTGLKQLPYLQLHDATDDAWHTYANPVSAGNAADVNTWTSSDVSVTDASIAGDSLNEVSFTAAKSPTSTVIASQSVALTVAGGGLVQFTGSSVPTTNFVTVGFSDTGSQLITMNQTGGNVFQLTAVDPNMGADPTMDAARNKIAVPYYYSSSGGFHVYTPDGTLVGAYQFPSGDYISDGLLSLSPDGSKIAWADYNNGIPNIEVMSSTGTGPITSLIAPSEMLTYYSTTSAQFSPDGTEVAFASQAYVPGDNEHYNDQIQVRSATTGAIISMSAVLSQNAGIGRLKFANNGLSLYAFTGSSGTNLSRYTVATGAVTTLVSFPPYNGTTNLNLPSSRGISLSPDGSTLAFWMDNYDFSTLPYNHGWVDTVNLSTDAVTQQSETIRNSGSTQGLDYSPDGSHIVFQCGQNNFDLCTLDMTASAPATELVLPPVPTIDDGWGTMAW